MKRKWIAGGALLALLVAAVGVWYLFLRDDAPDAVTADAANEQLDADLADADADGPEVEPADDVAPDTDPEADALSVEDDAEAAGIEEEPADGIDGTWVIDGDIGEFDFETASGSFAGFRVEEELTVGEVTAVGRSGGVSGSVIITDGALSGAEVTVDMTSIVSNDGRRENAIRSAVKAAEFADATFTFAGGVDVSSITVGAEPQSFTVEGELTIAGVTNPVSFAIDANVRDDGFGVIVGSTEIVWDDFGVTPPSAPVVVSIAEQGTVEFQLIVARG